MPRRPAAIEVELPQAVVDEIAATAAATRRSAAFIVARALAAAPGAAAAPDGPTKALALSGDEDDPPALLARVRAARPDAIAGAWSATRARFAAWVAREREAARAEDADDLDSALREASDPGTPAARLADLAANEYPRVRALVAQNPAAPPGALERLRADRDRGVQAAMRARAA